MEKQEEFLVKDADHVSVVRAFPMRCKGHMASAADTESLKNPAASRPKRTGPLLVPQIPTDISCLPKTIFHCSGAQ